MASEHHYKCAWCNHEWHHALSREHWVHCPSCFGSFSFSGLREIAGTPRAEGRTDRERIAAIVWDVEWRSDAADAEMGTACSWGQALKAAEMDDAFGESVFRCRHAADRVLALLSPAGTGDGPGTPAARFNFLLNEFQKRGAYDELSSRPPEVEILAAFDALAPARERERTTSLQSAGNALAMVATRVVGGSMPASALEDAVSDWIDAALPSAPEAQGERLAELLDAGREIAGDIVVERAKRFLGLKADTQEGE